jgi:hypothetical protein
VTTEAATTPALELADYLTAVADHLREHPHLHRVVVHTGQHNGDLQLGSSPNGAEDLHAWWTSLEHAHIVACPWFDEGEHEDAYVAVHGLIATGMKVRVWAKVKGLGRVLGYEADAERVELPVDEAVLVDFALTSEPQDAA